MVEGVEGKGDMIMLEETVTAVTEEDSKIIIKITMTGTIAATETMEMTNRVLLILV